MKCDELKPLKNLEVAFNRTTEQEQVIAEDSEGNCYGFDSWEEVYLKDEVDDAIAELKCELKDVTDDRNEFKKLYREQTEELCIEKTNVDTLEQALNQMQRTLWLARANRAHAEWAHWATIWFCNTNIILNINKSSVNQDPYRCSTKRNAAIWRNMWNEVERKCRAKAEAYK